MLELETQTPADQNRQTQNLQTRTLQTQTRLSTPTTTPRRSSFLV
jgi:hypothetical protein